NNDPFGNLFGSFSKGSYHIPLSQLNPFKPVVAQKITYIVRFTIDDPEMVLNSSIMTDNPAFSLYLN
ncbi:MAG: hypothetical protein ACRC5C_14400, partial [Bacilli bacterium]